MFSRRLKTRILFFCIMPWIYMGLTGAIFVGDKGKITEYSGKLKPRWEYVSSRYEARKPPSLILAVKGGATHTVGVLFRYDKKAFKFKEVYRSQQDGSSLNHAPERALSIVRHFVSGSIKAYPNEDMTVVMGMAATEFPTGRGAFFSGVTEIPRVVRAILTSDAETAWLSVFDKEGLIVIAGTGGVSLAVAKNGQKYQSGGYGGPISDYPGATSLVFDYDRCSEAMSCFYDGMLKTSKPLPLLERWIKKHDGNAQHFFAYRSQLLTTSKNDEYASRAKDIIDYYKENILGQSDEQQADSLVLENGKREVSKSTKQHKWDCCASYAMNRALSAFKDELMVKQLPVFKNVPFALDGTVAEQLWQIMESKQQTKEFKELKQRKSLLKPDLIAGALRLIYEDIPVDKFRAMIHQKNQE